MQCAVFASKPPVQPLLAGSSRWGHLGQPRGPLLPGGALSRRPRWCGDIGPGRRDGGTERGV